MADLILTKPSEGFFLAKRQMVEAIDGRMNILHKERIDLKQDDFERRQEIDSEMQALEKVRSYIRNVLLWDTSKGL